ncbi:hypothetical protein [Kitasatospora indigofera]
MPLTVGKVGLPLHHLQLRLDARALVLQPQGSWISIWTAALRLS